MPSVLRSLAPDLSADERLRLRLVVAGLLLLITVPYVVARDFTPDNWVFQWLLFNPDDQNVHLMWARQASEGHLAFRDLYSTESLVQGERARFTNVFCLAMGWLSRTGIPLLFIWHIFRLAFAALALTWFYWLCSALTSDKNTRFAALLLAAFSMGCGWLLPLFPNRKFVDRADLGFPLMPEAFTFSSALIFPMFIASIALLALIYYGVVRAQQSGARRFAVLAGVAAFFLSNIHTYDVLPLNVTLILWAVWSSLGSRRAVDDAEPHGNSRMRWQAPLIAVLCSLPFLAYQVLVFKFSAEFSTKATTQTPPPPVFDMALSYGLLLLLAMAGAYGARRSHSLRLPVLWSAVTLAMIYAPPQLLPFGRKMIEGVHLPLCLLAAVALANGVRAVFKNPTQTLLRRAVTGGIIAILCVSSLRLLEYGINSPRTNDVLIANGVQIPPLRLHADDAAALRFLASPGIRRDRAVLCSSLLGNYVPPTTGHYVYIGHWAETQDYSGKLGQSLAFFSGRMEPAAAREWLKKNRIGFVIGGFYEQRLSEGGMRLPVRLRQVFSHGETRVYEVSE